MRLLRSKKGSTTKSKSTTQTSIKRKAQVTSPAEGSYESSAKRRKSTPENSSITETPVKRNTDRGKRKSSVKYTDSTTDEDELFAATTKPATAATSVKRNAGRSAKVDRSDPEWLVTNENSPLANEDLHAEFSDPKTYENFTKSDWEDLRETLPPNVPCNPDGYSIPMTFFKYDPDFRRGIREFQEDLASGRLEPEWQADAALAMEERARGDFDSYKENEFEAFWGQKQKLKHDALAGESAKIKLELLIQNGLFKVGDSFNYSRMFGRGKNGVLVEKATTIETDGDEGPVVGQKGDKVPIITETAQNGRCPEIASTGPEAVLDGKAAEDRNGEPEQREGFEVEASAKPQKDETLEVTGSKGKRRNGVTVETNGGNQSSATRSGNEDTLYEISNLSQLEHKVVDMDGRFQSKEMSVQNTWKTFRCSRNNQDMGTLFEIRDEFYVHKHPKIVKEAKRRR
ncbi:Asx homology domain-containing protein [Usnea florida]